MPDCQIKISWNFKLGPGIFHTVPTCGSQAHFPHSFRKSADMAKASLARRRMYSSGSIRQQTLQLIMLRSYKEFRCCKAHIWQTCLAWPPKASKNEHCSWIIRVKLLMYQEQTLCFSSPHQKGNSKYRQAAAQTMKGALRLKMCALSTHANSTLRPHPAKMPQLNKCFQNNLPRRIAIAAFEWHYWDVKGHARGKGKWCHENSLPHQVSCSSCP